jgi:DNA-binding NarL/FixJ family response regulator
LPPVLAGGWFLGAKSVEARVAIVLEREVHLGGESDGRQRERERPGLQLPALERPRVLEEGELVLVTRVADNEAAMRAADEVIVDDRDAIELLADGRGGVGYLLKDRLMDVADFVDAVRRVAEGGTALDPEVVAQLFSRQRGGPLERLTSRELEVLGLMAEGRSNAGIAEQLVLTVGAVEKHIASILTKLRLPPSESDHRRVLAVLTYLQEEGVS